MSHNVVPSVLICAAILGCDAPPGNPPDVGGPSSLVIWSGEGESSGGTVFRVGTLFAIWTDCSYGGGGSESSNSHEVTFRGHLTASDNGRVSFSGKSTHGGSGTTVINDKSYDLKNGCLFLVATGDDGYRVRQLIRDLASLDFERKELKKLASADIEIAEFFAGDRAEPETR